MNTLKWTDEDKINFKKKLKELSTEVIKQKIDEAIKAMERAQEAANDEGKSSMGDKYEISKVMGQIDSDRAGQQLFEGKKQLLQLNLVNFETIYTDVQPGAFIVCDEANYFIATSIGGKVVDGEKINIISALAPIALQLMNKKKGSVIKFNGKELKILELF
jgi:transcription elongation GreA/GreB family factor